MSKATAEAGQTTVCRECYKRIPAEAKYCPDCGTAIKTPATVPVILVLLLLGSSIFLISSSVVTAKRVLEVSETTTTRTALPVTPPLKPAAPEPVIPKDVTQAAYDAVRELARERYPNAQRISEINQSPVSKVGDAYVVTLYIDSVENKSVVRNVLQVKVQLEQGKWVQKELIE
jgi:ribosomal protein L40E